MNWILQISAGTGPREVRAFVAALAPALAGLVRGRGLEVEALTREGEADAPRSVSLVLAGEGVEGQVADLLGTHALVARSADRSRRSRKRWFAGVSLHPAPGGPAAALDPAEVAISACRAGGPGGQHVNTTASAVRATHLPTGISVRVESQRSQASNRRAALEHLARALVRREEERRADLRRARRSAHYRLERGRPVETWRPHPRSGALEPEGGPLQCKRNNFLQF
jgi:putative peptide chain release factor H